MFFEIVSDNLNKQSTNIIIVKQKHSLFWKKTALFLKQLVVVAGKLTPDEQQV